jgi:hypothetical protein
MKCFILICLIGLSFGYEDKTVAQYLKDTPGFVTLASLLQSTGLDAALDKDGTYVEATRLNKSILSYSYVVNKKIEPRRDKTNKVCL